MVQNLVVFSVRSFSMPSNQCGLCGIKYETKTDEVDDGFCSFKCWKDSCLQNPREYFLVLGCDEEFATIDKRCLQI